jgi:hypothetical protein
VEKIVLYVMFNSLNLKCSYCPKYNRKMSDMKLSAKHGFKYTNQFGYCTIYIVFYKINVAKMTGHCPSVTNFQGKLYLY